MNQESDLERLIKLFSKLPSLGPRSGRRLALHLLNNRETLMRPLIDNMNSVLKNIKNCQECGNLDIDEICSICKDQKRDNSLICVVEEVSDLWAVEKGNIFNGKYHILGGVLSAIDGKGPQDLNIDNLLTRIKKDDIKEVILATNPTVHGQTTAYYLAEILKDLPVKISKLANGIPIGSELDYLDEGTLGIAFQSRKGF